MMKVPFVDLKAQYRSIKDEIDAAIQGVIESCAFVKGKYVGVFEQSFAEYCSAKHCIGVGNGTDAIFIALKSLGVGEGDEVITAANTFIATSEAITRTGAKVVFVDGDSDTYNIDIDKVEEAITDKTRAVVPVHLYGHPAEMGRLRELAGKHGLSVVEDAAQAHGAECAGERAGTLGNAACFSFYPGKNLGAYGDGGAVVTNDDDLAARVRMMGDHGRLDKYNHEFEGTNSRLDGLQAAILSAKLNHLEEWNERRRAVARMYDEALGDVVVTPSVRDEVRHVYHLYVVRVKDRDDVRSALSDKGVSSGIHYPIPLPFLKAYDYLGHTPSDFPVAEGYKDELLSLPMHGNLTDEQAGYVVETLKDSLGKR